MRVLLICLSLLIVASEACKKKCGDEGWTYFDETKSCYKLIEQRMNFTAAEKSCAEEDAHLTSIHSETENNFVTELAKAEEKGPWSEMVWIGMKMTDNDLSTLRFTDGSEFTGTFKNWASRQPDDQHSECIQMLVSFDDTVDVPNGKDGMWDDKQCYTKLRGGICKKSASKSK